jgi:hypothetical protein
LWPVADLLAAGSDVHFQGVKRTCPLGLGMSANDPKPTDGSHPSKRKGSGFEPEVVKLLQGYAIEAVKIPLSGSVAGFAGDIGAVLTRQDISTNLQCEPSRRGRTGPKRRDR